MRNTMIIAIVLLIIWNCFLTVQVAKTNNDEEPENVYVENTINGYTTDITEMVKELETKVVTVVTYDENDKVLNSATGIVYASDSSGVSIVTNAHVITNAYKIMIGYDNGMNLEAEITGTDELYDVALLLTHPDFNVTPITIADSSAVKKGEYVVAMGSVLNGSDKTVTFGVASGVDLQLSVDSDNDGVNDVELMMIQTDAAINSGNSGGPLVNLSGELIGMNTMSVSGVSAQGLNFAISSNEVVSLVEQIKEYGSIQRAYLGITGKNIADMEVYQKSFLGIDLELDHGVYVEEVAVDSASEKAGIQPGDIIVKIGNTTISNMDELRKATYQYKTGDSMLVTYVRANENGSTYVNFE